jgi:murein DD-endopeptidase MepM/ murein hydrolase activator NlpD
LEARMDTIGTNHIRFKDKGVAIGVAALSVLSFFFVYRSAGDRHELERLREQNTLLTAQLKRLDVSFKRIRQYTKTAGSIAAYDVKPTDIKRLPEPEFYTASAAPFATLVGRGMTLAAKAGPTDTTSDLETFTNMLSTVDTLNRETDVVVRRLSSLATILKYNKDVMKGIPSVMPVEGRIASEFGVRLNPITGKRHMHAGVDIAAELGTEVVAPADGEVSFVGQFEDLGLAVVVNHGTSRVLTRYGHLSRANVRLGDKVKKGQTIAFTGNSGHSTGPHLHYEVWVKNAAVNPRDFFFDMSDQGALTVETPAKKKKSKMDLDFAANNDGGVDE